MLADARSDASWCDNRRAVEPCFSRSMPTIAKNATDIPIRMMENVAIFVEPGISILFRWERGRSAVIHVAFWQKDGIELEKHGNKAESAE